MMGQPTTSRHIDSISPTRLEELIACPLRIAWSQQGDPVGARPLDDAALKGVAAHRAIELLVSLVARDVEEAWTAACDELAAVGPDPRETPGAQRVRSRLSSRYPQLADFIERFGPAEALTEQHLSSDDSRIAGIADLVLLGDSVAIVDYKTGLVTEEDDVKSAFRRQILIYSKLAKETYGRPISHIALFSLRQGFIAVDADEIGAQAVWDEAIEALDEFNRLTPGEQPARATPENCRWCTYNLACSPGIAALVDHARELGGIGAVSGCLIADPIAAANGRAALFVRPAGPGKAEGLRVTNVPTGLLGGLAAGVNLTLVGLRRRSDDGTLFTWADGASKMTTNN